VLPDGISADIDLSAWSPPPVFGWIAREGGVAEAEMLRTFNCGIGLAVVCAADEADRLCALFAARGEEARIIGRLRAAEGKPGVRFTGSLGFAS
jgi:phosphoribosylformylglycinamidine cyclo-ligase